MKNTQHPFSRVTKIVEINGESVALQFDNGEIISWPVNMIPKDKIVGDELRIIVHDHTTEQMEREALAKAVLNEIFASTKN